MRIRSCQIYVPDNACTWREISSKECNDSIILNTMYFAILVITEFKYQSKMYRFAFTQWRNAQQLGKVSNWPNTRQSKVFTQFPLEGSFKLLENMKCLLTNVKRFQTLNWFFSSLGLCTLQYCSVVARYCSVYKLGEFIHWKTKLIFWIPWHFSTNIWYS